MHPNAQILRPAPNFEKLFTGAKVWRKARKFGVGRKTVHEIHPRLAKFKHFFDTINCILLILCSCLCFSKLFFTVFSMKADPSPCMRFPWNKFYFAGFTSFVHNALFFFSTKKETQVVLTSKSIQPVSILNPPRFIG